MPQIKLIPLIELPTKKDDESNLTPSGTPSTNTDDWLSYFERELRKNYSRAFRPISPNVPQYSIHEITEDEDWLKVINLHLGDTDIRQSCSLFGGYALQVDGKIELYPQCCGEFEEINDWRKILEDGFKPFYLTECHPSPKFFVRGENLHIECLEDPTGPFIPDTKKEIVINLASARQAFLELRMEMETFSKRLDKISVNYGLSTISDILIWGKN